MVRYIHRLKLLFVGVKNRYAHQSYDIESAKITFELELSHQTIEIVAHCVTLRMVMITENRNTVSR